MHIWDKISRHHESERIARAAAEAAATPEEREAHLALARWHGNRAWMLLRTVHAADGHPRGDDDPDRN